MLSDKKTRPTIAPNIYEWRLISSSPITEIHLGRPDASVVQVGRKSSRRELNALEPRRSDLAKAPVNDRNFNDRIQFVRRLDDELIVQLVLRNGICVRPSDDQEVVGDSLFIHGACLKIPGHVPQLSILTETVRHIKNTEKLSQHSHI